MLSRFLNFIQRGPPPVRGPVKSATPAKEPSTAPSSLPEPGKAPHNPLVDLALEDFLAKQAGTAWQRLLDNVHPEGSSPGCVVASPSKALPDYWYEWTRDSAVVERAIVHRFMREGGAQDWKRLEEYVEASRIMQHKETVLGGFENGGLGEVKYHVNHEPFTGDWGRPQADGPGSRIITLGTLALHLLSSGDESKIDYVKRSLYPGAPEGGEKTGVLKGDLEYVATHWRMKGFDLWEEVSGRHFYTLLTLRTALFLGARLVSHPALAAAAPDSTTASARYIAAADLITPYLTRFWDDERAIMRVTIEHGKEDGAVGTYAGTADGEHVGTQVKREKEKEEQATSGDAGESDYDERHGKSSELDVAVVLAVLHAGRESSWARLTTSHDAVRDSDRPFETAEKVLSTLAHLVEAMADIYPLNEGRRAGGKKSAVALGRYPEDKYDGVGMTIAHPWYLACAGAAEFLYVLVEDVASLAETNAQTRSTLVVTPILHSALTSLLPALASPLPSPGSVLHASDPVYPELLHALFELADGFLGVIQEYVGVDGALSEQFERTGAPRGSEWHEGGVLEDSKKDPRTGAHVEAIGRGARHLTWSYAAFISAVEERAKAKTALEQGAVKGKQRV
ncbi:hypothetical protein Rhopal_005611-T1 [Rhodotorula paludigena]|uniref:glucan 1,4-alpha-glucosidase n=1 Tax=Rhodotorula paludigena TaxID=86838 RepID=A0AAV5GIT5_9BASI|nr:hypothetical protein Rhopal_005611-T1 [Rhodotorula paludigena]